MENRIIEVMNNMNNKKTGKVFLVGAGPGDIGLLTLKAVKCLKKAEVVIYDYHLNAGVLKFARSGAEFIYAGKRGGAHEMTQDQINAAIVAKAQEGKIVCRLKGGDPFVFGRGGEEAEALHDEGIPFEVVPGVSSAIAAPAYAGIPLTHRDYSSSFAVITGSEASTKEDSTIDWQKLATGVDTLVFLMAMSNIAGVMKRLMDHGRSTETPVAIVRWGTRPDQSTVVGTLLNISELVIMYGIKSPAVVIVGNVVKLRDKLKWYEDMPLFGQRVLVASAGLNEFDVISELGAEVLEIPCARNGCLLPTDSQGRPLRHARHAKRIVRFLKQGRITVAAFTSPAEVTGFFDLALEEAAASLKDVAIAAIDEVTKKAIELRGFPVTIMPAAEDIESLVQAIIEWAASKKAVDGEV
jgi:uroporphyrinogen III methyltransferase/synthase